MSAGIQLIRERTRSFKPTLIVLKEPFVVTTVSVDRPAQNTMDAQWVLHSDVQLVNVPTLSLSVPVSRFADKLNEYM